MARAFARKMKGCTYHGVDGGGRVSDHQQRRTPEQKEQTHRASQAGARWPAGATVYGEQEEYLIVLAVSSVRPTIGLSISSSRRLSKQAHTR